jgi:hypothetical protein
VIIQCSFKNEKKIMFGTLLTLFESTQRKLGHEKMGLFGFARIPGHREVIVRFRLIFEQGSGGRRSSILR